MSVEAFPQPQFNNRKGGLVMFGVFTILGGCVCALIVPLVLLAPVLAARRGAPVNPPFINITSALVYSVAAVSLVWLGIGSVIARRWARALLAIQSWVALICGAGAVIIIALLAGQFKNGMESAMPPNQPHLTGSAQTGIFVGVLCFSGLIMIVLPLIWALFYSASDVKATCEALDPVVRWTDRCPMPVLAASVWLAIAAILSLGTLIYGVAPFFGVLLTGNAARAVHLGLAAIWAYSAWAIYRLDKRGWWTIFSALILFAVSSLITFRVHDVTKMYSAMGYSNKQIMRMSAFGPNSHFFIWAALAWTVPSLGYLLYIRKFFPRSLEAATPAP